VGADLEQVRWWSWRRQRLDRSSRGIDDCLRSIIGVYSANPMGALSLLARVPRLMQGMVEGAIDSKTALRLPAMRRTTWLLHSETAHLAFRATSGQAPLKVLLRRSGVSEDEYARLEREILLAAGLPKMAEQIREAIKDPPEKLNPVLGAMTARGTLLRIKAKTPLSNAFSYAATRVWLGHELPEADPTEALVWLAGDYLKAFGPATVEDFAWWSGVELGQAEAAIRAHDPADMGDGLLMWATDVHAFEGTRSVANRVNLLPAWDPYTMGYAESSRARFADPDVMPFLYDKGGNATSVILIDGTVAGLWDFTLSDRKIEIRIGLFEDPTPRALEGIEAEAGLVAGYFHARDVQIRRVKIRSPISERVQGSHLKPLAEERPTKPKTAPPKAGAPKPAVKPVAVKRPAATKPALGPARRTKGSGATG
jgi:winged helix DNA-binding protein